MTAIDLSHNPFIPTDEYPPDEITTIGITIPRDLAVQIVGSDAGKERRFRPTATMTKGVTDEELAYVELLTRPFLEAEIHRYHEERSERMADLKVQATSQQAYALCKFCTNLATHLQEHWDKKGQDTRHHRSKQRLDQARDVIRQINRGLGIGDDDGRTPEQLRTETTTQLKQLANLVATLIDRAKQITNDRPEDALCRDEIDFWEYCRNDLDTYIKDVARYE